MNVLFSEGPENSRINALTKLTTETHPSGQCNFRSSVYCPTLPLVPVPVPTFLRSELTAVLQMWSMFRLDSIFGDFLGTSLITLLSPLWFSALALQILNTYLFWQVTLSYGDPENKHNVVSVGGVFGLQQDPTRLVFTSKTRSPYLVHVCHL